MSKYTKYDLSDLYDEHLNNTLDQVLIGNLCYAPAQVLKDADPVAYRQGLNAWIDAQVRAGELSIDAYMYS